LGFVQKMGVLKQSLQDLKRIPRCCVVAISTVILAVILQFGYDCWVRHTGWDAARMADDLVTSNRHDGLNMTEQWDQGGQTQRKAQEEQEQEALDSQAEQHARELAEYHRWIDRKEQGGRTQRKAQEEQDQEALESQAEQHARELADLCGRFDDGSQGNVLFGLVFEGSLMMSVAYKSTMDGEKRLAHLEAAKRFSEASQISPQCAELHAAMGSQLFQGGEYSSALAPWNSPPP
jgi:hypothetical protein